MIIALSLAEITKDPQEQRHPAVFSMPSKQLTGPADPMCEKEKKRKEKSNLVNSFHTKGIVGEKVLLFWNSNG